MSSFIRNITAQEVIVISIGGASLTVLVLVFCMLALIVGLLLKLVKFTKSNHATTGK